MPRTNLFFKVEIDHDPEESPERVGGEIARLIARFYGVRSVELTNHTKKED